MRRILLYGSNALFGQTLCARMQISITPGQDMSTACGHQSGSSAAREYGGMLSNRSFGGAQNTSGLCWDDQIADG